MENHDFKFGLGIGAKSIVSGFKGTITARLQHLNGCDRYFIAPKVDKDGKLPDGYWFDEGEVDPLKSKKIKTESKEPGGYPSQIK